MSAYLLPALIIGYVIFEVIEHVVLPLAWSFAARKRKALCGNEAMLNKLVEVKSWQDGTGLVLVDGELWKATSEDPLQSGDKATIGTVDGLILKIASFPLVGEGISNR
jgi:membrane-bound ClpP family serine protease